MVLIIFCRRVWARPNPSEYVFVHAQPPDVGKWGRLTVWLDAADTPKLHTFIKTQQKSGSLQKTDTGAMSDSFLVGKGSVKITVDEVILWDTELTLSQVKALHDSDPDNVNSI